jgi:hypothetical protein
MGRGMVEPVMSRAGAEKRRVGAGARVCAHICARVGGGMGGGRRGRGVDTSINILIVVLV